jgi:hypothetical protein
VTVVRVSVDDALVLGTPPPPPPEAAWSTIRRIVAEAVILQDRAEELVNDFRYRPEPAEVARPCGLVRGRFVELREALPSCRDPDVERCAAALRQILDHHILMMRTSFDLLAGAERSDALADRLYDIDGLGAPARRLDAIRQEIAGRR